MCILMTYQTLSLHWLYIYQMAEKGAEYAFVQLLSVNSKNEEIIHDKIEICFEEGFVSC